MLNIVHKNLKLNGNDLLILEFLSKFGYCQQSHLLKLLNLYNNTSSITLGKILKKLIKLDLIVIKSIFTDRNDFILLTNEGCRQMGVNKVKDIVLNSIYHDMLVIDILLYLKKINPNLNIQTDKEIKRITGFKLFEKNKINIPDLLVDSSIAIEVELTAKSQDRLIEIINSYICQIEIKEVHYYVLNESIADRIISLNINNKFKFFKFDKEMINVEEYLPNKTLINMANNVSYNLDNYLK